MYDVAVVGAGVVGLMVAYTLAKARKKVLVIEKEQEVGRGVTAGQATVLHVVQLPFGSLKSKLARIGNLMYDTRCEGLGVRLRRLPALLVVRGWKRIPLLVAAYLYLKIGLGREFKTELKSGRKLRALEPLLSDGVSAGLVDHGYGTVDVGALMTKLRAACEDLGAEIRTGTEVTHAESYGGGTTIGTTGGDAEARFVVNAAGLDSDEVAKVLGSDLGRHEPGLGVMAVYSGLRLGSIVAPLPVSTGGRTKGGAIIPATDGTTIVGPTLRVAKSKEDTGHTDGDLESLARKFGPLLREQGNLLRVYTGMRPLSPTGDFVVSIDRPRKVINLVGIESPGLTAAPALAEMVAAAVLEDAT